MNSKNHSNNVILLTIGLLFSGCMSLQPYVDKGYQLGNPCTVTTGSVMMYYEIGWQYMNVRQDGFRQELIYAGIDHNVVQISYRELFVSAGSKYARPSYNLELKYDLQPTKIIAFREYKIRIDSADGSKISYTILSQSNTSPMNQTYSQSQAETTSSRNDTIQNDNRKRYIGKDRKRVVIQLLNGEAIVEGILFSENDSEYNLGRMENGKAVYITVRKADVKSIQKLD